MRRFFATLAVILSVPCLGFASLFVLLVALKLYQSVTWSDGLNTLGQVEPIRWVIAASALVVGLLLLTLGRSLGKSTGPSAD